MANKAEFKIQVNNKYKQINFTTMTRRHNVVIGNRRCEPVGLSHRKKTAGIFMCRCGPTNDEQ